MAETVYVVQLKQQFDIGTHDEPMSRDAWVDYAEVTADKSRSAIKKAVENAGTNAISGEYRAFPKRSDSRETITVQYLPQILFGSQEANDEPEPVQTALVGAEA